MKLVSHFSWIWMKCWGIILVYLFLLRHIFIISVTCCSLTFSAKLEVCCLNLSLFLNVWLSTFSVCGFCLTQQTDKMLVIQVISSHGFPHTCEAFFNFLTVALLFLVHLNKQTTTPCVWSTNGSHSSPLSPACTIYHAVSATTLGGPGLTVT